MNDLLADRLLPYVTRQKHRFPSGLLDQYGDFTGIAVFLRQIADGNSRLGTR
ncbi:MAG: hypothetical protein M3009_06055 [Bombella apis]|uniref:hypothetical protein n=1 Tax=Bombella apis TaxID=1785988 RepID=UPI0023F17E88|nr:hypothetical protein [Bombella apis]MCT6820027.1 hypothetical protein [Bombella apis]